MASYRTGDDGFIAPNGNKGMRGPMGEPGDLGVTGPSGIDGLDGEDGEDGVDGVFMKRSSWILYMSCPKKIYSYLSEDLLVYYPKASNDGLCVADSFRYHW